MYMPRLVTRSAVRPSAKTSALIESGAEVVNIPCTGNVFLKGRFVLDRSC